MKRIALFAVSTCLFALWQFPGVAKADDGAKPAWTEALDEVNAIRAARGLPPYVRDDSLTAAAARCAITRAEVLCAGHTANDFVALDPGCTATGAGCAAWHPSMGWGSCCVMDRETYGGAAFAYGRDGKRYMHLFVSNRANQVSRQAAAAPSRLPAACPNGQCPAGGCDSGACAAAGCAGGSCQGCAAGATSGRIVLRFGERPLAHAIIGRVTHPFGGRFRCR